MRKKTSFLFHVLLVMVLAVCLSGCRESDVSPEAAEDEIKMEIQLDVKEDIGLLVLDNKVDGTETGGGISNADRSKLKHDEVLYWSLSKEEYKVASNAVNVSVRFRVITEYCDPNYENQYPEEYTVLLDPISFQAEFGKAYHITITGDRESGYQATLDE